MKKLEQKQIPQFAALCVLTAGVAGYGVMHLMTPGTASAGTRPATPAVTNALPAKPGDAKPGGTKLAEAKPGDPAAFPAEGSGDGGAPPPSPAMRDPFVVGIADSSSLPVALAPAAVKAPTLPGLAGKLPPAGARVASLGPLPVTLPDAPAGSPGGLSGFPSHPSAAPGQPGSLPSAPAALALPPAQPAPPAWTVTGVLQGADGKVAILRSGEARRIVRSGDFVDSTYKVTGVSRTAVVLRHGALVYRLALGAAKLDAAKPGVLPAVLTQPGPAPVQPARPQPLSPPALSGPALSENLPVPAHPGKPSPVKVARAIRLGLRLLDGTVLDKN